MRDMVSIRRGNNFRHQPQLSIGRSQFDRSHGRKMSFDASYLYPILIDEVLPGDTFTLKTNGFIRIFSPLDAPVMDNIEVETIWFYCPTRLLWDNWAAMNGEHNAAGAQDTDYTIPIMDTGLTVDHDNTGTAADNLAAYFGLPHGLQSANVDFSCLPFRMYAQVYDHWFRDQNIIGSAAAATETGNGPDTPSTYALKKSAKKHDYFTSMLPYLQKGDPVALTFDTDANVITDAATGAQPSIYSTDDSDWHKLDANLAQVDLAAAGATTGKMYADLTSLTGITINALRESVAIQRLLERDARGGTRLVETIKHQFGVTVPDYRVQRTEFLGSGKSYVNISPVANTSDTATVNQGELRGIGTGRVTGGFAKTFVEHGYVMGLIRARADLTYFQGLDKMWSRSTRYDFYIPALAHLGEDSVLNKEIYVSNVPATDDGVLGYQMRWEPYRTKKSDIVGLFNPDVTGSLSHWHLAEDFGSLPTLSTSFIQDNSPLSRVTTVDTEHDFIADLWFDFKCARAIPVYSIPSIMGGRF